MSQLEHFKSKGRKKTFLNQLIDDTRGIEFPALCLLDIWDEDGDNAACYQTWSDLPSAGPELATDEKMKDAGDLKREWVLATSNRNKSRRQVPWCELAIFNTKFSACD